MFRTIPNPARAQLGFTEQVLSAFRFLTEFDLRCVRAEPTFVRYESSRVFVNIYHDHASYELGVEIGLLVDVRKEKEQAFSIGEIIDLMGAREETGYTFMQASTTERVKQLVPKLAELVRHYAGPALQGNFFTFEQLEEARQGKSDKYLKEIELGRIRSEAEKAWHEKNYSKLVELYSSIQEDLTPTETKKLAYARKHL